MRRRESSQGRVEDQANVGPQRAVAEPVTDVVAKVQSVLTVGEQQGEGAFPVLIEPGGGHPRGENAELTRASRRVSLRDVHYGDATVALYLS